MRLIHNIKTVNCEIISILSYNYKLNFNTKINNKRYSLLSIFASIFFIYYLDIKLRHDFFCVNV